MQQKKKIMYCKTKKKIFVLFHVQNEKFREKNKSNVVLFPTIFGVSGFHYSSVISDFQCHRHPLPRADDIARSRRWMRGKRVAHEDDDAESASDNHAQSVSASSSPTRWKFFSTPAKADETFHKIDI